jgi:hypothetical protein
LGPGRRDQCVGCNKSCGRAEATENAAWQHALAFQMRALGHNKRAHGRRCDAFETFENAGHSSALAVRHQNEVPTIGLWSNGVELRGHRL